MQGSFQVGKPVRRPVFSVNAGKSLADSMTIGVSNRAKYASAQQLVDSLESTLFHAVADARRAYNQAVKQLRLEVGGLDKLELAVRDLCVQFDALEADPKPYLKEVSIKWHALAPFRLKPSAGATSRAARASSSSAAAPAAAAGSPESSGGPPSGLDTASVASSTSRLGAPGSATAALTGVSMSGSTALSKWMPPLPTSAEALASTLVSTNADALAKKPRTSHKPGDAVAPHQHALRVREEERAAEARLAKGKRILKAERSRGEMLLHMRNRVRDEVVQLKKENRGLETAVRAERARHADLQRLESAAHAALDKVREHIHTVQATAADMRKQWAHEIAQKREWVSQRAAAADYFSTVVSRQDELMGHIQDSDAMLASAVNSAMAGMLAEKAARQAHSDAQRSSPVDPAAAQRLGEEADAAREQAVVALHALRGMGIVQADGELAQQLPEPAEGWASARADQIAAAAGLTAQEHAVVLHALPQLLRHTSCNGVPAAHLPRLTSDAVVAMCQRQDELRKTLRQKRRALEAAISKLNDELADMETSAKYAAGSSAEADNSRGLAELERALTEARKAHDSQRNALSYLYRTLQPVLLAMSMLAREEVDDAPPAVESGRDVRLLLELMRASLSEKLESTRRNLALKGDDPAALAVSLLMANADEAVANVDNGSSGQVLSSLNKQSGDALAMDSSEPAQRGAASMPALLSIDVALSNVTQAALAAAPDLARTLSDKRLAGPSGVRGVLRHSQNAAMRASASLPSLPASQVGASTVDNSQQSGLGGVPFRGTHSLVGRETTAWAGDDAASDDIALGHSGSGEDDDEPVLARSSLKRISYNLMGRKSLRRAPVASGAAKPSSNSSISLSTRARAASGARGSSPQPRPLPSARSIDAPATARAVHSPIHKQAAAAPGEAPEPVPAPRTLKPLKPKPGTLTQA